MIPNMPWTYVSTRRRGGTGCWLGLAPTPAPCHPAPWWARAVPLELQDLQPRWAPWLWRRPSANSVGQVVAYLLADTLGIEILEGGAMRLGENATKDAVAAKDGAQKLRNVVWDLTPPCRKAPA
jgi:hypothetical protein